MNFAGKAVVEIAGLMEIAELVAEEFVVDIIVETLELGLADKGQGLEQFCPISLFF